MTLLGTVPPTFEMVSIETYRLGYDFTNALATAEVISTATSTVQMSLYDITNNALYGAGLATGSVQVSTANVISAVVQNLLPGHEYRLVMGGEVSSEKKPAAMLHITCRF